MVAVILTGCGTTTNSAVANSAVVIAPTWPSDMPEAVPVFADASTIQQEAASDGQNYWALQMTGVSAAAVQTYTQNLAATGWESSGAETSGQSEVLQATNGAYSLELVYNPLNQVLRLAVTLE